MANSIIICFAFIAGFIVSKTFIDLVRNVFTGTTLDSQNNPVFVIRLFLSRWSLH